MVSEEELKRKYNMLTDTWKFYRKYADAREDDEYWQAVVDESNSIAKKYDNCRFVRDLLLASISELERVYKTKRAENSG